MKDWIDTVIDFLIGAVGVAVLIWLALTFPTQCSALDRCESLKRDVRIEHIKYFSTVFPWWYGVGQLKQESCCRTTVTAFDGGQGVAQFMPKTAQYIMSLMGEKLNPYNPQHAIRMQAFYMARIHKSENWTQKLWIDYQIYNGGASLLKKEAQRAGSIDWNGMRKACKRKVRQLKNGKLDLCDVNYDYSQRIYKYGQRYKVGADYVFEAESSSPYYNSLIRPSCFFIHCSAVMNVSGIEATYLYLAP